MLLNEVTLIVKPNVITRKIEPRIKRSPENEQTQGRNEISVEDERAIEFTLIDQSTVELKCSDTNWRVKCLKLARCVIEFLSPSCYQNRRWKLSRDDCATLMEYAFMSIKVRT